MKTDIDSIFEFFEHSRPNLHSIYTEIYEIYPEEIRQDLNKSNKML